MFWILCENNVANTLMFWFLPSSATLSQGFFSISYPGSKKEQKNMGGSAAGAAEPNWPRGILHHRTSCPEYKLRKIGWQGVIAGQLSTSQQVIIN